MIKITLKIIIWVSIIFITLNMIHFLGKELGEKRAAKEEYCADKGMYFVEHEAVCKPGTRLNGDF